MSTSWVGHLDRVLYKIVVKVIVKIKIIKCQLFRIKVNIIVIFNSSEHI